LVTYVEAIAAFERGIDLAYRGGNVLSACVAAFGRTSYLLHQGRLVQAEADCRALLERVAQDGHADLPALGLLHLGLARIAFEQNRLDLAEILVAEAQAVGRDGGFSEMLRFGRYVHARLAAARRDCTTARAVLADAERVVVALADPQLAGEVAGEWATLELTCGTAADVRERLVQLEAAFAATGHADLRCGLDWLRARLACDELRYHDAIAILQPALERARLASSRGELLRLLVLHGVALAGTGSTGPARVALGKALAIGVVEGFVRRWLDAGPAVQPILGDLRQDSTLPAPQAAYLEQLASALQAAYFAGGEPAAIGSALDVLSERERDVLRLIAAGHSNRQIAEQLIVTLHTVKKHSSNIYGKLGVTSRTAALARARELGLL
jgi:LuxR family maltose regulon positive regulatory protein